MRRARAWIVALGLLLMAASAFGQSKEALDKYYKGLKELDWREKIGGNGPSGYIQKVIQPPNAIKAEKLFRESAELAPEWPMPWFALGDLNFVMKKFSGAAEAYQKARDLDTQKKQLKQDARREVIDQLGLSLAMSRKLEDAKKAYEAGLKEDPGYPVFEYQLSCVYAEQENLEEALVHLRRAWEHKDQMPSGQPFPDPRKDDSFKNYWDDPDFQEAVRDMVI